MRIFVPSLLALILTACQGNGSVTVVDPDAPTTDSTTTTGPGTGSGTGGGTGTGGGGCGAVNTWPMSLSGRVMLPNGGPAAFADVWLEERAWHTTVTTMGSDVANAEGFFDIPIAELVDVEDCWGLVLDYVLVGEQGPIYAERGVNTPLFNAIQDASFAADVADLQLQ